TSAWAAGVSVPIRDRRLVEQALVIGALCNCAVGVLQAGADLSGLHLALVDGHASGLLGNPAHLGPIAAGPLALLPPPPQRGGPRPGPAGPPGPPGRHRRRCAGAAGSPPPAPADGVGPRGGARRRRGRGVGRPLGAGGRARPGGLRARPPALVPRRAARRPAR